MNFIGNTSIGQRLTAAFAILIALMLLTGAVGVRSLSQVQAGGDTLYNDRVVPLQQLKRIADAYAVNVIDAVNKAHAGRMSAPEATKNLAEASSVIGQSWKDYMATTLTAEEAKLAREAEALFGPANADIERARAALQQMKGNVAGQLGAFNGPMYEHIDPISAKLTELIDLQLRVAKEVNEASAAQYRWASTLMIAMIAAAVAMAALGAFVITRSITRPLADALQVARSVAKGDLSARIEGTAKDETGQLLAALRDMTHNLTDVVSTVRNGSDSVATASTQIAQGNLDLSSRTEEQASALQQTAATMHELGSTVRNSADSARQADQLARGAAGTAAQGGVVMNQVVSTMHGITESSRKIGDIIGVIDGIAFQTNILALNAAVEAARAGEQGRGFAVVASEVRSLAQRSAEAAKEIKSLISRNVEQVEQGSTLVDQAGSTMREIVESIQRVSTFVGEISSATSEQSNGISQVGDAVSQMDTVTQQNAALVEESAAAAESLKAQAQQLVQAVAFFRLAGGSAA